MRDLPENRWPKLIGRGLAYLQHGMDTAVKVGAAFMEGIGDESQKVIDVPHKNTIGNRALAAGKSLLRFVGKTGKSYFEEYEKLKTRR